MGDACAVGCENGARMAKTLACGAPSRSAAEALCTEQTPKRWISKYLGNPLHNCA